MLGAGRVHNANGWTLWDSQRKQYWDWRLVQDTLCAGESPLGWEILWHKNWLLRASVFVFKTSLRKNEDFFNEKGAFLIVLKRKYGIFVRLKTMIPFLSSKHGFAFVCLFHFFSPQTTQLFQNSLTLKDCRENIAELRTDLGILSVVFWQCFNKGIHKTAPF